GRTGARESAVGAVLRCSLASPSYASPPVGPAPAARTSSSWYFSTASLGASCLTSSRRASSASTAVVTDSASTWKYRRVAPRGSGVGDPATRWGQGGGWPRGTQGEFWSGTASTQSEPATNGPGAPDSTCVRYGVPGSSSGYSSARCSQASASRRSSVQEVADQ